MENLTRPLFSILHTSARPGEWEKVYRAWLDNADHPEYVEYVLVVDHDWGFTELPILRPQDKVVWQAKNRHCYVDGVNLAASVSTGSILIVNADDQFPCARWDTNLLLHHNNVPVAGDFIILASTGTPDEHMRQISVMPILSRARYERLGWVLYPAYESMYSDNDFLAAARAEEVAGISKVRDCTDLPIFPHLHPLATGGVWDEAYLRQNRQPAYQLGEAIFAARKQSNFGVAGMSTDGQTYRAPLEGTRPKLAILAPGETFSMEWVVQWTELVTQLQLFFEVTPWFSYTSNVFITRGCLAEAAVASGADFVLWLDDDNLVAPGQVCRLYDSLKKHKEIDIVTGWCWLQEYKDKVVDKCSVGRIDGEKFPALRYPELMAGAEDLVPIDWSGFPVVLMRTEAIKRAGLHPFTPLMDPSYPYGMSGEDIAFFKRAGDAGVRTVCDRTVKVKHLKRKPDEPDTLPASTVTEAVTTPEPELVLANSNSNK